MLVSKQLLTIGGKRVPVFVFQIVEVQDSEIIPGNSELLCFQYLCLNGLRSVCLMQLNLLPRA